MHAPLETLPYYCTLCDYRAMRASQLERHIQSFPPHLRRRHGVTCPLMDAEYFCKASKPYQVTWTTTADQDGDLYICPSGGLMELAMKEARIIPKQKAGTSEEEGPREKRRQEDEEKRQKDEEKRQKEEKRQQEDEEKRQKEETRREETRREETRREETRREETRRDDRDLLTDQEEFLNQIMFLKKRLPEIQPHRRRRRTDQTEKKIERGGELHQLSRKQNTTTFRPQQPKTSNRSGE